MTPLHSQFLVFSTLIMLLSVQLTHAMSTITAIAKDQITCTMCSSCDNPCQPISSPPPSSNYSYPPPPSPPQSPPYNGGGGGGGGDDDYYSSVYLIPPPPNPIVPYFPFYFHNPPSPYTVVGSKSVQFKNHPFITFLILVVSIFLFR